MCPKESAVDGLYCVNCQKLQLYKIADTICNDTECKDGTELESNRCSNTVPEGYFLSNATFNYYQPCDSNCKTCVTSSTNCLSCNKPILYNNICYDKCPDETPQKYELDGTCKDCPNYLYSDNTSKKCVNCKPKYKNIANNECDDALPVGALLLDDNYNSYTMCHSNCESCTAPSIDDNDQKCTRCKEGKFLSSSTSGNCIDSCGDFLVTDTENRNCINCKYF